MTQKSKPLQLGQLFPELGLTQDFSEHAGLEIKGLADLDRAEPGHLAFCAQDRLLSEVAATKASVVVVSNSLWDQAQASGTKAKLLRSRDAMLAFAKSSRHFATEESPGPGREVASIHPTAKIAQSAHLGAGVSVGPEAVIEDNVTLHAGVTVGARSRIGKGTVLFPGVVVYHDVSVGERVRIHANTVVGADGFGYVQEKSATGVKHVKIHHLGGVRIGNDVEIGASTTIDRGTLSDTVIGNGCIIDNQVQIGHNCVLEEGVVLCGCVGLSGSAYLEKYALVAGFSAVANKVRVGMGAQVAGFTALTHHVPAGEKWGGIPPMPRSEYARLLVYFKRLPELFDRKKKEARQ